MGADENPRSARAPGDREGRLQQIDVLKGLAVLSVVATHSLTAAKLVDSWAVLHIWQAVPLFVVILAANASMSFDRRRAEGAGRLFTVDYIVSRAVRILAPFALIWLLAWIVGRDKAALQFGAESWLLQLPYPGPGNYYVPLVVVLLLLAPLLYVSYRKSRWLTLGALIALDLVFELLAARIPLFESHPFVYSVAFPRYLAAFALGFLVADSRLRWRVRATVLGAGMLASLAYLYVGNSGSWSPPFVPAWRTQNVLAAFYPAALAALGMRLLPQRSTRAPLVGLAWVGRASYHVYLVQMLYFMLVPRSRTALMIVVNVVLCAFAGLGFYFFERWLGARRASRGSGETAPAGSSETLGA